MVCKFFKCFLFFNLKPPNICMNTRGYVKLIDFADAKLIKDDDTLIDPVGTVGIQKP